MLSFYLAIIDNIEDKCKFEELYLLYRFTMLKAAENILRDFSLTEDTVHEAFLRILSHIGKIGLNWVKLTKLTVTKPVLSSL